MHVVSRRICKLEFKLIVHLIFAEVNERLPFDLFVDLIHKFHNNLCSLSIYRSACSNCLFALSSASSTSSFCFCCSFTATSRSMCWGKVIKRTAGECVLGNRQSQNWLKLLEFFLLVSFWFLGTFFTRNCHPSSHWIDWKIKLTFYTFGGFSLLHACTWRCCCFWCLWRVSKLEKFYAKTEGKYAFRVLRSAETLFWDWQGPGSRVSYLISALIHRCGFNCGRLSGCRFVLRHLI